jgi:hypothetical protein
VFIASQCYNSFCLSHVSFCQVPEFRNESQLSRRDLGSIEQIDWVGSEMQGGSVLGLFLGDIALGLFLGIA